MERLDHTLLQEWLHSEADGSLSAERRAALDEHVAGCAECQRERAGLAALAALLAGSNLAVRPDFKARVMAALPAAGWEGRHPRTWSLPAAVCLLLGAVAVYLLGHGAAGLGSASAALLAVGSMLRATVEAGAGLLNASWKGLGMVVQESLSSRTGLVVFGIFVLCINVLLISMVRRKVSHESGLDVRSRAGR